MDLQPTAGAPWHLPDAAVDRLCELYRARSVYDSDELGASRQAAMVPCGKMLLARERE
ncbi:MAG TPA: hypothetical protein VEQ62_09135 [Stellaceae bacterium]|nr:hypothetical protein [Stellaceae bacterium]